MVALEGFYRTNCRKLKLVIFNYLKWYNVHIKFNKNPSNHIYRWTSQEMVFIKASDIIMHAQRIMGNEVLIAHLTSMSPHEHVTLVLLSVKVKVK
jgi:hypothetical protein